MCSKDVCRNISAIMLCVFMLALPIITFVLPKADFSPMENRTLAAFPKFSTKTVFDRSFMNGLEKWFSDHFVGRDTWVGAKGQIEYAIGKRENNSIFLCDNRFIEDIAEPDMEKTQANIDGIKAFVENNKMPTYIMLVPTAADICRDYLPANAQTWDQRKYIKEVSKQLTGIANEIDVYKPLYEARDSYIYYRTDHHWTTLGAYYAFAEAGKRMGFYASYLRGYNMENVSHDFYGTLYSKAGYRNITPDTISLATLRGYENAKVKVSIFDGKETKQYDSLYFRENLKTKDQYLMFLGENQPVIDITTDVKNGKSLVIFKDSYANSLVPYLTNYYSRITMVDLRYINVRFSELVDVSQYDQALLVYNVDTFAQASDVAKLGY